MAARPVALVTGAAQRIGRDIALALAARGWDVAVHTRRSIEAADATAADIVARGGRAQVLSADLADESQARALVPQTVAAFGRLDAVVNNASTFVYDDAAGFGYAALESHLRANTGAPVLLATALAEHVAQRAGDDRGACGCVVNLLDQKLANPNPDYFSYTLSKAALDAATTMLAMALAPRVRVCGVSPGVTLLSGEMTGDEFQASHTMTPLGRSSTPEDIARAVAFLLESPAITGTTLLVDGGQHLMRFERDFSLM
jgi:NAD(P)-dependent dehydrogenase (short-subunit alcohol dehydrogenase family)